MLGDIIKVSHKEKNSVWTDFASWVRREREEGLSADEVLACMEFTRSHAVVLGDIIKVGLRDSGVRRVVSGGR